MFFLPLIVILHKFEMRLVEIAVIFAVGITSGCKKTDTGAPAQATKNNALPEQKTGQEEDPKQAVVDYSRIFEHYLLRNFGEALKKDENLARDVKAHLTTLDSLLREKLQTWGVDVAVLRAVITEGSQTMIAKAPRMAREITLAVESILKVVDAAVNGEGLVAITRAVLEAITSCRTLLNQATIWGAPIVSDILREFQWRVSAVVKAAPGTADLLSAVGGQFLAAFRDLMTKHPKHRAFLEHTVRQTHTLLASL